ncbi:MAG: dehydrogenase E1 component subunit alpha/beta, partial [Bacteroidetes bacterium]|nr:dehydrogenase E1 component subunit alpha/beta [Bacteroidota bacterium]
HFGSREHAICGMISHLGPQLGIADGVALAYKLGQKNRAALVFTGEGGTSEGDFHEALNLASVWDLPVIFLVENNGYALSTPVSEQYRCESIVYKAEGYGMEGVRIDGNNILTVYDTLKGIREYCIKYQRPYLVECMTFRMRGHEEASGTKYVPQELLEDWAKKDPIANYENWLRGENVLSEEALHRIHEETRQMIEDELAGVLDPVDIVPDTQAELGDVYATPAGSSEDDVWPEDETLSPAAGIREEESAAPEKRFVDAISEALHQSMERDERLILMGQDIAEYGGAFKITEGFVERFGRSRVRNTPLCESAVVGCALGLSLEGYKSVMEMQFADFVTAGFNQIVNNLGKIHYRWGQAASVVIRMPTGAGVAAGPFHSQSNEAWFVHTPGLKVVYPSTPRDAKGLLIAAINDPNPVLYFEHKALYRSISGPVPEGYYEVEIGKARQVQQGEDLSIITYGAGVHWATDYAKAHPGISIDILDLRSLLPIDHDAIRAAVGRTGKVMVLHEDTLTGGIGAEIAAWIGEHCYQLLDAPVIRCASLDTPIPFNARLERNFLAVSRLDECVKRLMDY